MILMARILHLSSCIIGAHEYRPTACGMVCRGDSSVDSPNQCGGHLWESHAIIMCVYMFSDPIAITVR